MSDLYCNKIFLCSCPSIFINTSKSIVFLITLNNKRAGKLNIRLIVIQSDIPVPCYLFPLMFNIMTASYLFSHFLSIPNEILNLQCTFSSASLLSLWHMNTSMCYFCFTFYRPFSGMINCFHNK